MTKGVTDYFFEIKIHINDFRELLNNGSIKYKNHCNGISNFEIITNVLKLVRKIFALLKGLNMKADNF